MSHLTYRQDTRFDNITYGITSFTPTQYSSHGPEDNWSPPASTTDPATTPLDNSGKPPVLIVDTSAALTPNDSATPPIYATVNKKISKKQREQTHSVSNENALQGEYSVLEDRGGEGGGGGDVVYQVLEGPGVATYEALDVVAAHQATNNPATNTATQDEEYSTLKYN